MPGGGPATGQDASDLQRDRFTAIASSSISVTSTPTGFGGTYYTTSTQAESLGSILDAAAAEAIQGDARGRLEAREVASSSVVVYALFYVFAEEHCTLSGRTERPRPAPKVTAASVPGAASTDPGDAASE